MCWENKTGMSLFYRNVTQNIFNLSTVNFIQTEQQSDATKTKETDQNHKNTVDQDSNLSVPQLSSQKWEFLVDSEGFKPYITIFFCKLIRLDYWV